MDEAESLSHPSWECKYDWCLGQQARVSARVQIHEAQWVLAADLAPRVRAPDAEIGVL